MTGEQSRNAGRYKVELPPLEMNDRSFALENIADFVWTAFVGKSRRLMQCTSSSISSMRFTYRGFNLAPQADATAEGSGNGPAGIFSIAEVRRLGS